MGMDLTGREYRQWGLHHRHQNKFFDERDRTNGQEVRPLTVSQTPGRDSSRRRAADERSLPSRSNLPLLAIPVLFASALVAHVWLDVSLEASVTLASGLSGAVVGDVLLRNPPTAPGRAPTNFRRRLRAPRPC